MWRILSFVSILFGITSVISLHNTESMISVDTPISSLDNDFDFPHISGLDFYDFGVNTDEIAGIQGASEFSHPDQTI